MEAIINAYLNERLSYRELLRKLIDSEEWFIPAAEHEGTLQPNLVRHNNALFLSAYTAKETIPAELTTIQKDGIWLFSNLKEPISSLVVDPQSPHALQFPSTRFASLQKWAKAIEIEKVLEKENFNTQDFETLLLYPGFCVPIVQSESGKTHITLAPDSKGRKLAAIFTAEDCLSAFMQHVGDSLGDKIIVDESQGAELFHYLCTLPLEGLVFNCYGPATPKALNISILEELLRRRQHDA